MFWKIFAIFEVAVTVAAFVGYRIGYSRGRWHR